jgi:hypothetical protein
MVVDYALGGVLGSFGRVAASSWESSDSAMVFFFPRGLCVQSIWEGMCKIGSFVTRRFSSLLLNI